MVNVFVNNVKVSVEPNTSVLKACEALKIEIPRFCYHKKLSIAGNCRMCLVEIEKSPKPVVSCAMPVMENMKIFTDTPLVKKAREGVLEFLLLNHPLDCPVCDQGGECDLQDQAMVFGSDQSRFYDLKRGVHDKKLGPLIKTIMTRCIHCTRCVRFATEIAGVEDLGTTIRGTETEIGTYIEKIFKSELSGNVIDLCPVGALTSKPYAFKARPWELKTEFSVDTSDGLVSDIKLDFKSNEIVRITPNYPNSVDYSENCGISVNEHPFVDEWISDKARFCYDGLQLMSYIEKKWLTQSLSEVEKKLKLIHVQKSKSQIFTPLKCWKNFRDFSQNLPKDFLFHVNMNELLFLSFLTSNTTSIYLRNSDIPFYDRNSFQLNDLIKFGKILDTNFNFFIDEDMDYNTLLFYNLFFSKIKSRIISSKLSHIKKVSFNSLSILLKTSFNNSVNLNTISVDESYISCPNIQDKNLSESTGLILRQKTNVSMSELEKSDLCLLIGTNPRYEGSLYNIHLRKRFLQGGFKIASIGSPVDLTYPVSHLGLGTQTLQDLALGKNSFFDEMSKAKSPMILLGSALLTKKDYSLIEGLCLDLASQTGVIPSLSVNKLETKPWLGFGVLQSKPNKLGEIVLGLKSLNELSRSTVNTEINFFLSGNKSKFNFLINNLKQIKKQSEKAFVYLIPVAINSYLERKNCSFLNTEGQLKRLKKVSNFSKKDKISMDPIKLLLVVQNTILLNASKISLSSYNNFRDSNSNILKGNWFNLGKITNWIKNHYLECFPGNMISESKTSFTSESKNGLNVVYPWKLYSDRSLSYDSLIEDFYLTDNIRKSSLKMSHCSALHRARTTNFF